MKFELDEKQVRESIKFLTNYLDSIIYKEKCVETHKLAIDALKKQIPENVVNIHVDEYVCPICGSENTGCNDKIVKDRYCPNCGQRLEIESRTGGSNDAIN